MVRPLYRQTADWRPSQELFVLQLSPGLIHAMLAGTSVIALHCPDFKYYNAKLIFTAFQLTLKLPHNWK